MKLSELQKKDIVNIKDGKKIGKIIDVYFDESIADWCKINFHSDQATPMNHASYFYILDDNQSYNMVQKT